MSDTHGHLFTAGDAARACGVARTTISRAAAAGKIAGAKHDENGAWLLPLAGLLAAGFNPGKPSPPEDARPQTGHRDDDYGDMVPRREAELEKEVLAARGEALANKARADELEKRVADLEKIADAYFQLQIEARTASPTSEIPATSLSTEQPVQPPVSNQVSSPTGKWKRVWNLVRHG